MKYKLLAILVAAAFLLPSFGTANAQGQGGNGLSISPTKNELVIERGLSEIVNIQVKNVSDTDILAKTFLNDFFQEGNTGNPQLIVDGSEMQSANSIKEFVTGVEDVIIPAGESKNVAITISIPQQASPGAYYGAIRFLATNPDSADQEGSQVSLNASVASLVLIEVPGDLVEKIEISNILTFKDEQEGVFFTKVPNKIGTEITNLGNGFAKPFGRIVVNGPFGQGQVHEFELNSTSPRGNVLPDSARIFLNDLEGVSRPGKYTIVASISHGNGGEVLEATSTFWYVPVWFILTSIVVLLLLVGGTYFLYRKYATKTTKRKR
jgi:hypothetical protein